MSQDKINIVGGCPISRKMEVAVRVIPTYKLWRLPVNYELMIM